MKPKAMRELRDTILAAWERKRIKGDEKLLANTMRGVREAMLASATDPTIVPRPNLSRRESVGLTLDIWEAARNLYGRPPALVVFDERFAMLYAATDKTPDYSDEALQGQGPLCLIIHALTFRRLADGKWTAEPGESFIGIGRRGKTLYLGEPDLNFLGLLHAGIQAIAKHHYLSPTCQADTGFASGLEPIYALMSEARAAWLKGEELTDEQDMYSHMHPCAAWGLATALMRDADRPESQWCAASDRLPASEEDFEKRMKDGTLVMLERSKAEKRVVVASLHMQPPSGAKPEDHPFPEPYRVVLAADAQPGPGLRPCVSAIVFRQGETAWELISPRPASFWLDDGGELSVLVWGEGENGEPADFPQEVARPFFYASAAALGILAAQEDTREVGEALQ